MRVLVAVETFHMLFAVGLGMAAVAFGHDLGVIVPQGVISVKDLMAFTAIELVQPPMFFDVAEVPGMTLPTLGDGQWLRLGSIKRRIGVW